MPCSQVLSQSPQESEVIYCLYTTLLHKQYHTSLWRALPHHDEVLAAGCCQPVFYLAFCHGECRNMVFSLLFSSFDLSTMRRDIKQFSLVSSLLPTRLIPDPSCVNQNSTTKTAKQCNSVVQHSTSPKAYSSIVLAQHISLYWRISRKTQLCVHPCSKYERLITIHISLKIFGNSKESDMVSSVHNTSDSYPLQIISVEQKKSRGI